jgi:NAD(P)-dependent dehydrogenase (short-subunit alcohol dehydrogenase family)
VTQLKVLPPSAACSPRAGTTSIKESLGMQGRFEGKTAIVTGAGRGIGESIALRLAQDGAEVLVIGRSADPLLETVSRIEAAGGRAWSLSADVSSIDDIDMVVESAMARWGHIDFLVNNAAMFDEPPFLENDVDTVRRTLDINVTGLFFMSQRVAKAMLERDGGSIVHISSIDSLGADGPYSAYTATKCAVVSLARTMARELAQHGIRVNCVAPGFVNTDMVHKITPPNILDYMLHNFERVPMQRLVEPEEIASAVAFLLSDDASAITGINLVVDCGVTCNLYVEETLPAPTVALSGVRE